MISYREATGSDDARVAVTMHPMDRLECKVGGHTPWQALHEARVNSLMCWAAEVDGWPEAMFGVVVENYATGRGYPWFLGSAKARRHQREFLKHAPVFLKTIETFVPRLEGHTHAENEAAIRWLQRLGFVVEDEVKTISGEPMRYFHKGF